MNDFDAKSGKSKQTMFAEVTTLLNAGNFINFSTQENMESVWTGQ